jgi:hypothetical protein
MNFPSRSSCALTSSHFLHPSPANQQKLQSSGVHGYQIKQLPQRWRYSWHCHRLCRRCPRPRSSSFLSHTQKTQCEITVQHTTSNDQQSRLRLRKDICECASTSQSHRHPHVGQRSGTDVSAILRKHRQCSTAPNFPGKRTADAAREARKTDRRHTAALAQ